MGQWQTGMKALAAAGPHVFIKLSQLTYIDPNWDGEDSVVPAMVKEIINLFGSHRFGSLFLTSGRKTQLILHKIYVHYVYITSNLYKGVYFL
jgi:hypothetical protein